MLSAISRTISATRKLFLSRAHSISLEMLRGRKISRAIVQSEMLQVNQTKIRIIKIIARISIKIKMIAIEKYVHLLELENGDFGERMPDNAAFSSESKLPFSSPLR